MVAYKRDNPQTKNTATTRGRQTMLCSEPTTSTCIGRHMGLSVRLLTSVLNTYVRSPVSSSRAIFRYGSLDVRSFLST